MTEEENKIFTNTSTNPDLNSVNAESSTILESDRDNRLKTNQLDWFRNVYQGDRVPQLTLRAVVMGGLLGSLMSVSNLYTAIKLGWLFGVAITACVLSFVIWKSIRLAFPRISQMSILENNCMQSTASAAGYSTGSTIATAFGAYLLITGEQVDWKITAIWTLLTALFGVMLAVPMKRQMINQEQLKFPSGIAAAETLRSLYGGSKEALHQAYSLVTSLIAGAITGLASRGDFAWQKAMGLKLPDIIPFNITLAKIDLTKFPGFGFEPSVMLVSAGMIVGIRVSISMLISSCLLYFVFAPWLVNEHIIKSPAKLLSQWAVWGGTAIMVSAGLTAFALQWTTILRALKGVGAKVSTEEKEMEAIEVPSHWFLIGIIPLALALILVEYFAFGISIYLGIISIVLSFFLAIVACRATGETDITPISAMGKISQLTFAALSPGGNPNYLMTTNLMAASVTANTASSSADLLTDLKSGYLLGANPKKQFLAQLIGVFFGTITIIPAWFLMIPNKETLEAYNPPSTNVYKAVAEMLAKGLDSLPLTARYAILIGLILGIVLSLIDHFFPKAKKFTPSAMGLGLAWIMPFTNAFSFFIGAFIAEIWQRFNKKNADTYLIPIASGAIAGESLACAFIAMYQSALALHLFGL